MGKVYAYDELQISNDTTGPLERIQERSTYANSLVTTNQHSENDEHRKLNESRRLFQKYNTFLNLKLNPGI